MRMWIFLLLLTPTVTVILYTYVLLFKEKNQFDKRKIKSNCLYMFFYFPHWEQQSGICVLEPQSDIDSSRLLLISSGWCKVSKSSWSATSIEGKRVVLIVVMIPLLNLWMMVARFFALKWRTRKIRPRPRIEIISMFRRISLFHKIFYYLWKRQCKWRFSIGRLQWPKFVEFCIFLWKIPLIDDFPSKEFRGSL